MVDLTAALRGESVPELDTIQLIDIDLLDDDPRNFYQLTGLEELAASIELLGLQDPVRVRDNPDKPGRYIIVSGHRRRAAIRKLVEDGKDSFRLIPCIRERQAGSAAMQELRLIYANKDTRQLTSAEIGKQAERVEALLYQLKEEGVSFPGRMRDHVAEACRVSKSKLARLKVIREKLVSNLQPTWEEGKIPESVAYRLAQEPAEIQIRVAKLWRDEISTMTEWQVEASINAIKKTPKEPPERPHESPAQAEAQAYVEELEEENDRFYRAMEEYGFEFLLHQMKEVGENRRASIDALKRGPAFSHSSYSYAGLSMACEPKGFRIQVKGEKEIRRSWTEVWDTMAVLALETSKFFDELDDNGDAKSKGPIGQLVLSGWMPGGTTPSEPCDVVGIFDFGNKVTYKQIIYWDGVNFRMSRESKAIVESKVCKWMALPPDPDDEDEEDEEE